MYYVNILNCSGKARGKRVIRSISFELPTVQAAVNFVKRRGYPERPGLITNWPKCSNVKQVKQA